MNCKFCAGDMAIEDAKCPHCGQENPYYEAHRIDMANFERKFKSTEASVVEKTNKYTRKTVIITAISVLFALILLCIFVLSNIRDITYNLTRKTNNGKASQIAEQLGKYEEEKEYILLVNYFEANPSDYRENELSEYYGVYDMCSRYRDMVNRSVDITSRKMTESSVSSIASSLNSILDSMYSLRYKEIDSNYLPERFNKKHLETMDDILDRTNHLMIAYFGIREEDLDVLKDLTPSKRTSLIEDRLMEVIENAE